MRTFTTTQRNNVSASRLAMFARLEVTGPDGSWKNVSTDLAAIDWLTRAQIAESLDSNCLSFSATLAREAKTISLAPLMTASSINQSGGSYAPALDLKRQWRFSTAVVASGTTPVTADWQQIGIGYIDKIDFGDGTVNQIQLTGRCLAARLLDSYIKVNTRQYSPNGDQSMEAVIQKILDDQFGAGVIPLYVPAPTGVVMRPMVQDYANVMDAITAVAQPYGFVVRYRYDSAGNYRLTLYQPNRAPSGTDWSIGPTEYLTMPINTIDISGVRNYIEVKYIDASSGNLAIATSPAAATGTVSCTNGAATFTSSQAGVVVNGSILIINGIEYTVSAFNGTTGCTLTGGGSSTPTFGANLFYTSASITQYGLRYMGIDMQNGSQINSVASSQGMANAVRSDIEFPALAQRLESYGLWFAQLHDYVQTAANGVMYDTAQSGAVTAYTHTWEGGSLKTSLDLSGKPRGRYITWQKYGSATNGFISDNLSVLVTPGPSSYSIAWSGKNVLVAVDGGTPAIPSTNPLVVTRDLTDHEYRFSATDGVDTSYYPVNVPAAFKAGPEVSFAIDSNGKLTVAIVGKPGADRTYIAVRTDRKPVAAEILPASLGGSNGSPSLVGPGVQTGQVANIPITDVSPAGVVSTVTSLPVGKTFYIGAISVTTGNVLSTPVWVVDKYLGVGMTPLPGFAFGSYTATDRLVTFGNVTLTGPAQRVEFFLVESNADPSPGSTTPPSVEGIAAEVFDWIERNADGTYQGSISFPVAAPSDYLSLTAIVIDALHQRGAPVTIKAQAAAAAPSAPNAPSLSTPPTVTSNSISTVCTIPSTGTVGDKLRVWVDGVQQPDIAAAAPGGTQTLSYAGSPGSSHSIYAKLVVSSTGAISGPSNTVTGTLTTDTSGGGSGTTANGKLPIPTINSGSFDVTSQSSILNFTAGGTMPSGTTYSIYRSTSSGGVYVDVADGCVASPAVYSGETQIGTPQTVYYKLVAKCPGYTDSDSGSTLPNTTARAVTIPAGKS